MPIRNYEIFETRTGRRIDDDDDVLRDGQTLRVPLHMRDGVSPMQRGVMEDKAARRFGLDDATALHRNGSRYCVDEAARARVEQARAEWIREMTDAWRTPPAEVRSAVTGYGSGSGVRGQRPGDKCTINGAPGHINAKGECVPDRKRRQDAMTMDEAQAIKDAAYAEMVEDLTNAWRTP